MTLPAETRFPCVSAPETDFVAFGFVRQDRIQIMAFDGARANVVRIDREQVESLRDQLTQWLEIQS